jgi:predicted amidohydrolase
VLAEAGEESGVLQVQLDLAALRQWRDEFPVLKDVRPDLLGSMKLDSAK